MHEGDKPSPWRLPRIGIEPETGQVACAAHDQYLCPSPAEADAPDDYRRVGPLSACWARMQDCCHKTVANIYVICHSQKVFGTG